MKRFEYKRVTRTVGTPRTDAEIPQYLESATAWFNSFGAEGWQIIKIDSIQIAVGEEMWLWLMREVAQ